MLASAEYNESGVRELLKLDDFPSLRGGDMPLLLRRTANGRPLDTLVRLFLMERPVDLEAAENAFQPLNLETLVRMDLIAAGSGTVEARVKLLPFQGLLIAFDREGYLQETSGADYVMGIGRSSLTLANLTIRRSSPSTLDLGTGCGIQGLLAASHSDQVTCTDLNDRAVSMASFNAQLNGLSNVSCLRGHLFEPVQDRRFDLIVSNPPFVISPESRYIYRDGGLPADQLCRRILREGAARLEEGGFCQILCNWAEYAGVDWRTTVSGWTEGLGCDAWVIRSESRDSETYASTWIQHTERRESSDWDRRLKEWLIYFDRLGIVSVGAGIIMIRRSSGKTNWLRAEEAPPKMLGPCGKDVERGFALRDFLENVERDELLLRTVLRVSSDTSLEQRYVPGGEGWDETGTTLVKTRGLAYAGASDTLMANLVAACDGTRTLLEVADGLLTPLGIRREDISGPLCRAVRGLILQGFLMPTPLT
ncbi:MAG: methyltransferase [Syntrophobacteraceae bacterium]